MRRAVVASLLLLTVVPATPGRAVAQTGPAIAWATPEDHAFVAGPAVELAIAVRNFELVPAGSLNEEGKGHAHILIDQEPPPARSFLPTNDPGIIHLGTPPLESRAVELTEGPHKLWAVLGDSEHLVIDHTPVMLSIEVKPGTRVKGPLDRACADVARGAGEVRMVFPNAGGHVQGTVETKCAFTTSEGACAWTDTSFRRIKGTFAPQTGAIQGVAAGFTTRQLVNGDRGRCGEGRTSPLGQQAVQAIVGGGAVRGTLGSTAFVLVGDPSVRLASPPATIAASSGDDGGGGRSLFVYIPFVAAALVIAAAVAYALRARKAPS